MGGELPEEGFDIAKRPASFGDTVQRAIEWTALGLALGRDIENELIALEGLLSPWADEGFRKRMNDIEMEKIRMDMRPTWVRPRKPNYQKKILAEWVEVARPFLDIRVSRRIDSEDLMISAR